MKHSTAARRQVACTHRPRVWACALAISALPGLAQARSAALEAARIESSASLPTVTTGSASSGPAAAPSSRRGKLLLTGGVSSIDGAAGGGLTPWAYTGSYASAGEVGATAAVTRVRSRDYALTVTGAALSVHDRLELSLAHQEFTTGATGAALGLPGLRLQQDIVGVKLRLAGDGVLDSDTWMPQIAIGAQFKRTQAGGLADTLASLGARDRGTDVYASATKLFLAQAVLVNATLRATQANQNGLLGFGAAGDRSLTWQPELSVAWLLRRDLAVGAEYRAKPDQLNPSALDDGLKEDDWKDLFVVWAPSKLLSLTLAVVDLGHIVPAVTTRRQTGGYVSAQLAF